MLHKMAAVALVAMAAICAFAKTEETKSSQSSGFVFEPPEEMLDSLERTIIIIDGDTLHTSFIPRTLKPKHSGALRAEDYEEIAAKLGVEAAAIRAVVEIETGRTRTGFHDEGKPIINFDLPVFRRTAARMKINLARHASSEALQSLKIKKYGSQQKAQQARLDAAMAIDSMAAIQSTFWGMFQIGGFNWKLCGAKSPQDFVERMSRSEYDQLELFANFISNSGMLKYLRAKNWAAFAKMYNGPAYASRGYHTRMASAYRKYSQ